MENVSRCCNSLAVQEECECCFRCSKCGDICEIYQFSVDLFLGGTWERLSKVPYKNKLKEAFPGFILFDPEDYSGADWFANNMKILKVSRAMFVMVPDFPFPLVAPEAGFFYATHTTEYNRGLDNIVICWPYIVQPDFVKQNLSKLGYVVSTVEEGIDYLRNVLC